MRSRWSDNLFLFTTVTKSKSETTNQNDTLKETVNQSKTSMRKYTDEIEISTIQLHADDLPQRTVTNAEDDDDAKSRVSLKNETYQYVRSEQIDELFQSNNDENDQHHFITAQGKQKTYTFKIHQLVWVCKSKGANRRSNLFCRARVVELDDDDNQRIRVRYDSGSTYSVFCQRLIPVLETSTPDFSIIDNTAVGIQQQQPTVLVYSETIDYRRACITHCCDGEAFYEIGCAEGILISKIKEYNTNSDCIIGIDKSTVCIETANERYPTCDFLEFDVLNTPIHKWPDELQKKAPSIVVAIDINGTRDLEAVLQCILIVMNYWSPRLIVVKSRSLYHGLSTPSSSSS